MKDLAGKIALVTGGSSGFGKATAKRFAEEGARVVIAARNAENLEKALEETGSAEAFPMDVSSAPEWDRAYGHIVAKYGGLDILVNNAGGGVAIKPLAEQTVEEIDRSIALNLSGAIYSSRLFGKLMQERKSGTIINVASVCARLGWPGWSVYTAAKAGLLHFTKCLYAELQPYGARASCVIPAASDTGFGAASSGCSKEPSGVKLRPEDIAETILYVAKLPDTAVVQDVTVWGINQVVVPL